MGDDAGLGALWSSIEHARGRRRASAGEHPGGPRARIPRATYRLQLHAGFTFADAAEIVPYLAELGISHAYCSPYLRARPGSLHGYDIVDHGTLNPEIGSPADFDHFCRTLRAHGMGQIADVVPNHMGVMGADNAWWLDVLENGPSSRYSGYFDIDWAPGDPALTGKVLLPILGEPYGAALERGELALVYEGGRIALAYHQHRFPLDPRTYPVVLARARGLLGDDGPSRAASDELDSLAAALARLPERDRTDAASRAQREHDKELYKARLGALVDERTALAQALDAALRQLNGEPHVPGAFDPLHDLLEAQAWRIAHWRVAGEEINYRRFFDINDLAAVRMEDPEVFEATHRFVLQLVAEGRIDGLRIDHPDGLYDPAGYFRRLQQRAAQAAGIDGPGESQESLPFYVVAEKIVAGHEQLPTQWAIHGTTGYRFANVVNGLFVDTSARARVDRAWRGFAGDEAMDFDEAAYRGKRLVLRSALAGELMVLARRALALARADRHTRDFTLNAMRRALTEVAASFPVYRTYVAGRASAQDRRFIGWAVGRAARRSRGADPSVFEFLGRTLLGQAPPGAAAATLAEYRTFAGRFAQFCAPVAAKGIEDTAFYVHNRLVSLNDVGGDPDAFGFTVKAFHRASADRAKRWPHTLLATSTHDNKRSEDVRARIDVISERPREWRLLVRRWRRMNRSRKQRLAGRAMPSSNDEYLLYQTLVGTFPVRPLDEAALGAYRERIEQYMLKAVHEAKVHTSWMNPDAAYDGAVTQFVRDLLTASDTNLFLADLATQAKVWAWFGALNSIAITTLKLCSPGVPDIYQGNELVDFSLVDPDNRRPVDFESRHRLLGALRTVVAAADPATLGDFVRRMLSTLGDGRLKLWVTWRTLALRREFPMVFSRGRYVPVDASGARAPNVVAFARDDGASGVVVVTGRLFASLGLGEGAAPVGDPVWQDTELELPELADETELTDALTGAAHRIRGGRLPVGAALAELPVALLQYARGLNPEQVQST
jgi:(1->4)-alpha-D-glucan 1-alpha-D-glucosylmutase